MQVFASASVCNAYNLFLRRDAPDAVYDGVRCGNTYFAIENE